MLICRVSGVATVEGCDAIMRAVCSDPRSRSVTQVINVEEGLDVSALTPSDIERIADIAAKWFANVAPVRSAIVTGLDSPTRYGLSRMFEAYAESRKLGAIRVFETFEDAVGWMRAG